MNSLTLWIGPIAAVLVGVATAQAGLAEQAAFTAGVAVLCAVWWVAEPIPIPVTSLLPLALFPVAGVITKEEVGQAYGHPLILLLLGGFILSTALERSGVHQRLAVGMVRLCSRGVAPGKAITGRRLVLGFMAAAAVCSMWVSNSATTLMLLPIAGATLERSRDPRLRIALLLGIAYAASVGGVGTPIGTPPNILCIQEYQNLTGKELTFTQWMTWGVPVAAVMIPVIALWLTRKLGGPAEIDLPEIGPWRPAEWRTLTVFGVTALLWITRKEPLGGWSGWFDLPGATDATVALLGVVVMCMLPSGEPPWEPDGPTPRLLDWETATRIPWGMLLLFSGGMVLAAAFKSSGLSVAMGGALGGLAALPTPVLIAGLCLLVTFMTEMTSNTATTALLMPLLGATAQANGLEPSLLMFPAAVSASFAFMLPVATAPNAIVYGAGIRTREMAREGFALNLLGVVVVTVLGSLLL